MIWFEAANDHRIAVNPDHVQCVEQEPQNPYATVIWFGREDRLSVVGTVEEIVEKLNAGGRDVHD